MPAAARFSWRPFPSDFPRMGSSIPTVHSTPILPLPELQSRVPVAHVSLWMLCKPILNALQVKWIISHPLLRHPAPDPSSSIAPQPPQVEKLQLTLEPPFSLLLLFSRPATALCLLSLWSPRCLLQALPKFQSGARWSLPNWLPASSLCATQPVLWPIPEESP